MYPWRGKQLVWINHHIVAFSLTALWANLREIPLFSDIIFLKPQTYEISLQLTQCYCHFHQNLWDYHSGTSACWICFLQYKHLYVYVHAQLKPYYLFFILKTFGIFLIIFFTAPPKPIFIIILWYKTWKIIV